MGPGGQAHNRRRLFQRHALFYVATDIITAGEFIVYGVSGMAPDTWGFLVDWGVHEPLIS